MHRRAHRELEAVPIRQHVRADARSIHQADAFEWHHPTPEQITIGSDARANTLECVSIECVRVVGRVFHEALLVSVLTNDDRLPVDLEVLIPPARELREQVLQISLRLGRGWIDEKLSFPGTRRRCAVGLHEKSTRVIFNDGFVALTVRSKPDSRF